MESLLHILTINKLELSDKKKKYFKKLQDSILLICHKLI